MSVEIKRSKKDISAVFTRVKNKLALVLADSPQIHHVGSTAVLGLDGKNILDILISAKDSEHMSQDKIGTAMSLDVLCFAMARLTDCDKADYPTIDWDDLASNLDGIATSRDSDVSAIRKIENDIASTYKKSLKIIKQQLS